MNNFIKGIINNMPNDWVKLTTHRLDIYNESLAKKGFLDQFEELYNNNCFEASKLEALPTAYDYIRLGHPLSSVLEWMIAKKYDIPSSCVISFSSRTIPIMAVLRKNLFEGKNTQINYSGSLHKAFDQEILKLGYGYKFELNKVDSLEEITDFDGTRIYVSQTNQVCDFNNSVNADILINIDNELGSILMIKSANHNGFVSEIQHVRRRETIAMTPTNSFHALNRLVGNPLSKNINSTKDNKATVHQLIKDINGSQTKVVTGSSGLSIQYALMMGLIHDANVNHPEKEIKFIVPPNCYGGTNDQARRVASCLNNVEVIDLPVDGEFDMVNSINIVLDEIAKIDAVPYIIAEIPTNPRVEVPNLIELRDALSKERKTIKGNTAVDPVFVLDQTFCPNVQFLGEGEILSTVRTISYASGSKFPSGGLCTAGYAIANKKAESLMDKVELHLTLCDNEATELQYKILAKQMPSMIDRIASAYNNTKEFVNFVEENLPGSKINFVSDELASQGFTPSVFSLDLPTKGNTEEEKETYKRELNLKLINLMISKIPQESKFCVSYGQLKGCYWTIPATSTQGTTKEGDKDYIVRVALSGNMNLEKHKEIFMSFVQNI